MEKETMRLLIDHVDQHVHKVYIEKGSIALLLESHSSRNGADWLLYPRSKGIEVVQAPNNTSHFLQGNDQ